MNTAQVVETAVTVNIQEVRSPGQSYSAYTYEMTPGFKPFTK